MSQLNVLTPADIEVIALSSLVGDSANATIITNTGLSPELIEDLSSDISSDIFITLVKLKLNDKWFTFSDDPTDLVGVDENGRPVYKTTWTDEDWMYLPFSMNLNSVKASGEIVGGSISIANYDKEIALATEMPQEAIPIKVYVISKTTLECAFKDEYKYLTSFQNNGIFITGQISPANILAETVRVYDRINFR